MSEKKGSGPPQTETRILSSKESLFDVQTERPKAGCTYTITTPGKDRIIRFRIHLVDITATDVVFIDPIKPTEKQNRPRYWWDAILENPETKWEMFIEPKPEKRESEKRSSLDVKFFVTAAAQMYGGAPTTIAEIDLNFEHSESCQRNPDLLESYPLRSYTKEQRRDLFVSQDVFIDQCGAETHSNIRWFGETLYQGTNNSQYAVLLGENDHLVVINNQLNLSFSGNQYFPGKRGSSAQAEHIWVSIFKGAEIRTLLAKLPNFLKEFPDGFFAALVQKKDQNKLNSLSCLHSRRSQTLPEDNFLSIYSNERPIDSFLRGNLPAEYPRSQSFMQNLYNLFTVLKAHADDPTFLAELDKKMCEEGRFESENNLRGQYLEQRQKLKDFHEKKQRKYNGLSGWQRLKTPKPVDPYLSFLKAYTGKFTPEEQQFLQLVEAGANTTHIKAHTVRSCLLKITEHYSSIAADYWL